MLVPDVANLYWEFRELRPSVVHVWLDDVNIRAGLAAVLAGVPRIILSTRSLAPYRFPYYRSYHRPAYTALREAPGVSLINNSRAGADDYATWLGVEAASIDVIYNGLDDREAVGLESAAARWRCQLEIPMGAPVVGGMFRFGAEKRPWLWLETVAEISARRPDAWFVLFGDGELRTQVRTHARRLGVAHRLRLPGLTAAPLSAMRAMDVLVMTSALEGLPNVLIEAQACGVPVVATRAGGTSEAVDHSRTGWIVDEEAPSALADRVVATLNDRAFCEQARISGPRFVSTRFGFERMIDETLDAYGMHVRRADWPAPAVVT
jgi:glycosyltransferase involved in cell wall biosynthesis